MPLFNKWHRLHRVLESENKLQTQLHDARAKSGTEDSPKIHTGHVGVGSGENDVVERIESLGPKLKLLALADRELSEKGQINAPKPILPLVVGAIVAECEDIRYLVTPLC